MALPHSNRPNHSLTFFSPPCHCYSLNIAAPDHENFHSVLFHFNPRHYERGGQLVLNNKNEGTWGQAINVPLSTIPLIFGQTSCTLIIQVNGEGFDVFLNDKHIARLEHRRELASRKSALYLNFPATDDYNSECRSTCLIYRFPSVSHLFQYFCGLRRSRELDGVQSKGTFVCRSFLLSKVHSVYST